MACQPKCKKTDLIALMATSNVEWLSSHYSKYVRDENSVGYKVHMRCKKNFRNSNPKSYYPDMKCVTDATTQATAWEAGTCVEIPTQSPCAKLPTMGNSRIVYSDKEARAADKTTAKIGSNFRVYCNKGFTLTGLSSYYGRCQSSRNGNGAWSNAVANGQPQCSRLPFRVGDIQTKLNTIDPSKCPVAKPIYSMANLCTVSKDCRDHVVSLFDDEDNFKSSNRKSTAAVTATHLSKYKGQISAVQLTCGKHSVCANKYNAYEYTKKYFANLQSKTYGKGANTRPRYNGRYLIRRVCRRLKGMGCCFRDFLKADVDQGESVAMALEATLVTNAKYCRNLPSKPCSETCTWDKKLRAPVQCTIEGTKTITRSFVNRGHAICALQETKYGLTEAVATEKVASMCHASKCTDLPNTECANHPLCKSVTDASISKCSLSKASLGQICVAQQRRHRRLSIPNHPHGRRMPSTAGAIDKATGRAKLKEGIIGTTKTRSPELCGKFCEDKGAKGCGKLKLGDLET